MEDSPLSPPVGASVWELEMFAHLTQHTRREGAILDDYLAAAEGTNSKSLAYLINLLVEDERRRHQYFDDLASSLKTDSELSGVEPVIPRLDLDRVDRAELLETTGRLLQDEQADATELKRLRHELGSLRDTTLWGVLIEAMLHDTEKHIAILRFISDHAKPKR